jgi:ubiquinone/menaquinone biosynthesis C-methylase UbiE
MKEFFEKKAATWDTLNPPEEHRVTIRWGLKRLKEYFGLLGGKTLVDLGCGTGMMVPHVLPEIGETGRLWAVDYAEAMVRAAKEKYTDARVRFFCEDAMRWPVPKGNIDGVLCYNSFPHFPKEAAFETVASWLRPRGFFLIWHGSGRKRINEIHAKAGGAVVGDILEPAAKLSAQAQHLGFKEVAWVDNGQRWFLLLKKAPPAAPPSNTPPPKAA